MISVRPPDGALMTPHAQKLAGLTRCPACGAPRNDQVSETVFTCTGAFCLANNVIIVATPCPAGSHVAADHLNKEVAAEMEPSINPPIAAI